MAVLVFKFLGRLKEMLHDEYLVQLVHMVRCHRALETVTLKKKKSLATEKSPPRSSSASTVAEWSVALSWVRVPAPGGEPRVFTAAHLSSCYLLILGLFWDFFGTGTCGEVKPGDVSRDRECEKINRRQPRRTSLV